MSNIPNTTVEDKVTHDWRRQWRERIEGDPARPIPESIFIFEMLRGLSTQQLLSKISDAIEERLLDYTNEFNDALERAKKERGL